jgi:hypothetical protein
MMDKNVSGFAIKLLHAVTAGHILHLQSKSFSQHMALGEFYQGVGDLIDSFIEAYQGQYGIITGYANGFEVPTQSALREIMDLSAFVEKERRNLPTDSELQNIVDEIQALIDSTLYKLRFLA